MNQQIVDIMYVSDMLVIKRLSGTIWPIFSSFLIFYYYLVRLKSREVSRQNMRNLVILYSEAYLLIHLYREKNIIFTDHIWNVIFHRIFLQRSSLIFHSKFKTIFSGNTSTISLNNSGNAIYLCNVWGKVIFP